ncbi:MAG: diphthine synthase [Candidatus Woesearchaeota archaeon]
MLYMVGIGLNDEKDITVKGLNVVKRCSKIYLENYTSLMKCSVHDLRNFYGKEIILADRNLVESKVEETILSDAKNNDIAILVVGDVFGATTHVDLVLRARKMGVKIAYVHNASILNAIGSTGLELYKFGKTTSMVFFDNNWKPSTPYDVIEMNKKNGLHTLVLLDIKVDQNRFMTVNECLKQLLELEQIYGRGLISPDLKVVGCARIGSNDQLIRFAKISELIDYDFGSPLHCLIIPGTLHFMEEEFLNSLD